LPDGRRLPASPTSPTVSYQIGAARRNDALEASDKLKLKIRQAHVLRAAHAAEFIMGFAEMLKGAQVR
jgi:hypothetical protein